MSLTLATIFVAATLTATSKVDAIHQSIVICEASKLPTSIELKRHGQLHFPLNLEHLVGADAWMAAIVDGIAASAEPVLVATPSHKLAAEIGARTPRATVRSLDETTSGRRAAGRPRIRACTMDPKPIGPSRATRPRRDHLG